MHTMQALRPFLRPVLLPHSKLSIRPLQARLPLLCRQQHSQNHYGPHKEYFQTPGQIPLPDTTPYNPQEPIQTTTVDARPSRIRAALGGIFWAIVFSALGVASGTAFITWEYLQPPYERGSPEEQDLLEEIEGVFDSHPLVQDLREKGWEEEEFYMRRSLADRDRGLHMVHDTLANSSQGLNIKIFKDRHFTMMVFFVGFGLDGFPDVMHGGITATLMLEAVQKHVANQCPGFVVKMDEPSVVIDYKVRVRPGEIYTMLLPPVTIEPNPKDHSKENVRCPVLLLRIDQVPGLGSRFNAKDSSMEHTVEIHTASGNDPCLAVGDVHIPIAERPRNPDVGARPTLPTNQTAQDFLIGKP